MARTKAVLVNAETSNFLNASRWIAAFSVVIFHVYSVSVHRASPPGLLFHCIHFFCGFGHSAVIVFFVISGFLIGGGAILQRRAHGFNFLDYFVHRFSRIYVVLVPALIAGFVLDRLGIAFFDRSEIYQHPDFFYSNDFGNNLAKHLTLLTFLGNLLSLQTITVSSFGSNGPLWSLANEWWYYVIFGFAMLACRPGPRLTRAIAGGLSVALLLALPSKITFWFIIWGMGAGAAVLDRYWRAWPSYFGVTIALACLIAVWFAQRREHGELAQLALDSAVAVGYSIALLCAKNRSRPGTLSTVHRRLASFSYSVYVVHFPAMVLVVAILKDVFSISFARPPSVATLLYIIAIVSIIYGYAWIFAGLTETHTYTVRTWLSGAISRFRYRIAQFVDTAMRSSPVKNA
jgi:peptidoglycan/LPS O-acetylase OafA/YrhL